MLRALAIAAVLLGLCGCWSDSQQSSSSKTGLEHIKAVGHGSMPHRGAGGVLGQIAGQLAKHQPHVAPQPSSHFHLRR